MDIPKNCRECRRCMECKSWYGGSMCDYSSVIANAISSDNK